MSIQVQFVSLKMAELSLTPVRLKEYITCPTIESVLTFSVDELSTHASVVNIEREAPKLIFIFIQSVWPEFRKFSLI